MSVFVISVVTVIVVSAFCSLSEASIYAVRRPFIRKLTEQGSAAGPVLETFKDNMERPIAAILVVNTAANTAGASVAGAQASILFGPQSVIWFSLLFTLAVLFGSEIVPKIVGVVHSRPVARAVALPWGIVITVLTPVVWTVQLFSDWLKPSGPVFSAPEEEVMHLAQISADEGSISEDEAAMVRNVLALDDLMAREVMTPRTVVLRLPSTMTVGEAHDVAEGWYHSRVPIFEPDDPEHWTGMVRSADVLAALAAGDTDVLLSDLTRPLHVISESTRGHVLLNRFIAERTHLFAVVDEFGGMAGVVSLEDVVESLVGQEIVDEVDQVADLQAEARRKGRRMGMASDDYEGA